MNLSTRNKDLIACFAVTLFVISTCVFFIGIAVANNTTESIYGDSVLIHEKDNIYAAIITFQDEEGFNLRAEEAIRQWKAKVQHDRERPN